MTRETSLTLKKAGFVLVLLLGLTCCSTVQLWPWEEVRKPWEPSAIAKAERVRAHLATGPTVTLYRAAIVQDRGSQLLVGRVWDPRDDSNQTLSLELAQVERLESRRYGPAAVGTTVSEMLGLYCVAILVLIIASA